MQRKQQITIAYFQICNINLSTETSLFLESKCLCTKLLQSKYMNRLNQKLLQNNGDNHVGNFHI